LERECKRAFGVGNEKNKVTKTPECNQHSGVFEKY
jgi:hypothetical protein